MPKTKFDKDYSAAFKTHFDRVEVPIMELSQIRKSAESRVRNGEDLNQVMFNWAKHYKLIQEEREYRAKQAKA